MGHIRTYMGHIRTDTYTHTYKQEAAAKKAAEEAGNRATRVREVQFICFFFFFFQFCKKKNAPPEIKKRNAKWHQNAFDAIFFPSIIVFCLASSRAALHERMYMLCNRCMRMYMLLRMYMLYRCMCMSCYIGVCILCRCMYTLYRCIRMLV